MANWKKITTDTDLTALSSSLTTTDQAISASVAALSGSASDARGLLGGADSFPYTGSAQIVGSLGVTGSVSFDYQAPPGTGVWSSGPGSGQSLPSSMAGTQDAGLMYGGDPLAPATNCTQHYNGTSWSSGGALSQGNYGNIGGAGIENSAQFFNGKFLGNALTEEYNGLAWSTGGTLSHNRYFTGQAGANVNATLTFSGQNVSGVTVSCTEEYNGTSFSTGGTINTPREILTGAGTQTATLATGGEVSGGGTVSCTEEYDGTTWNTVGGLNTARNDHGAAGTPSAGLVFGGSGAAAAGGILICTEEYNGFSWSTVNAMSVARFPKGAGSQTAALAAGGNTQMSCTEEFTKPAGEMGTTFCTSSTTGAVILSQVSSSLNFTDDTTAAAGGIPLGGLYRNGNFIVIRLT